MHILHIIDSLAMGGAERMLVDIANATRADGHTVSVCITRQRDDLAAQLKPDIPLTILGRKGRFDLNGIRAFARLVRERQPDILHIHGRSSFSFAAFVKTLHLIPDIPILMHDHYGGIEVDPVIPPWFIYWGKYLVGAYVGVYGRLGKWAEDAGVPQKRIFVVDNALDLERLYATPATDVRAEFGIPAHVPVGITIGGLRYEKGTDFLLDVVERVDSPFRLLVVGPDADPAFAQRSREDAARRGLLDKVIFTGRRTDAPALLKGCDFAVMPSRSESGPLVLIEYMAIGLPFVSTLIGGISRRANELGARAFVPFGDVTTFADELDALLKLSPDERRARSQEGKHIADNYFNMHRVIAQWYAIYDKLLSKQL